MIPGPFLAACDYLLDRHVRQGRGDRLALTGVAGEVSYAGYPAMATGKIRRVALRAQAAVVMQAEPGPPPAPVVPL